jgi:hypothetical protein
MPLERCPNKSRRCITGKCVKKKPGNGKRCPRGTRKCANGVCYSAATKQISASKKIQKAFRNYKKAKTAKATGNTRLTTENTFEEKLEYLRKKYSNLIVTQTKNNVIHLKHKTNESACATFELKPNHEIYIGSINRCGEISGTKILNIIESFAKKFGYKKLELEDDSRLLGTPRSRKKGGRCEISLALLSVLATGETWYNKVGFKSVYYQEEKKHNRKIIQQPFITFITRIAERVEYTEQRSRNMPTLEDLIHGMYYYVDKSDSNISVQNLFKKVMANLRDKSLVCDNKEKPEMDWLVDIGFFLTDWGAFQFDIEDKIDDNIVMVVTEDSDNYVMQVKNL